MIRDLRRHAGGFTIVETVIVLAVSIALLSSALLVFQGRIPRVQFESAVNELDTKIQDAANQVASGYYPSSNSLNCTNGEVVDATTGTQGTNQDCIFIGQVMQFDTQPLSTDRGEAVFYTVTGKRATPAGISTSLSEANPKISNIDGSYGLFSLGYGTKITKATYSGGEIGGVAFLQTFGTKVNGSGQANGASQVEIVPLPGISSNQSISSFVSQLNGTTPSPFLTTSNPSSGITLCIQSGTTSQWGTITLAKNGAVFDSEKAIFNSKPGGC